MYSTNFYRLIIVPDYSDVLPFMLMFLNFDDSFGINIFAEYLCRLFNILFVFSIWIFTEAVRASSFDEP